MLTIILIAILLVFLYLSIWVLWLKPEARKSSPAKDSEFNFKFPQFSQRAVKVRIKGRFSRKVLRFRMRMMKGYKWGTLGLSVVSRAIHKSYRAIISREQRKYYAKTFGIPFIAYRGF